jgi:hypothetical protein
VLEAAMNTDANLPMFIRQFQPSFPVGAVDQMAALQFMEISPMIRTFVPYIAFIDRKGMIRNQLTGDDLADEMQASKSCEITPKNLVNEPSDARAQAETTHAIAFARSIQPPACYPHE